MSHLRRKLAVSVTCGLVVAGAVALLVPRTQPSMAAGARNVLTGRPAPIGDVAHPRMAPARRTPRRPGYVILRAISRPRIEVRLADPLGGPPWAIRVFMAKRLVKDRGEPPHVIGRPRCAQLGRVYRGRFGWIDATNTFRPVGITWRGSPNWCGSRLPDEHRNPAFERVTRITDPQAGTARTTEAVAWGMAGPAGTPRLTVDGRPANAVTGSSGTFLAAIPHDHLAALRLEVDYADGEPRVIEQSVRADARRSREQFRSTGSPRLAAEQQRKLPQSGRLPTIELRLPDPNGGLPWGSSALPADGGGWCTSGLGRIVDDRVGGVDYELGTFTETPPGGFNGCPHVDRPRDIPPNRAHPLALEWSAGGGLDDEPGRDPARGRIARRTLRGLAMYFGTALPSVREITIETPRDVRTIVPSPRAHAFAAIYDGSFPTGRTVLTARMADGSTRREVIDNGGF